MPRNKRKKKYAKETLRKKSIRFQKNNPEFVSTLVIPFDEKPDNRKFFQIALKRLLEDKNSKFLLNFNPKFRFNQYTVVPLIFHYLKPKTLFIRNQLVITLEKQPLGVNKSYQTLSPIHSALPMAPSSLLFATNPMPSDATWCKELQPYFLAIAATYRLRTNFSYQPLSLVTYSSIYLDPRNAITFLSMGKESLWSLSKLILNPFYSKIVVVFVNNASPINIS